MGHVRATLMISFFALAGGPLPLAAAGPEPVQVGSVLRHIDEAFDWAFRVGKNLPAAQAEELMDVLKAVARSGDDITPEVLRLLKRDYLTKCTRGTLDPALLRLMSDRPELCEVAWALATKAPIQKIGPRLVFLAQELGASAPRVLGKLASAMPEQEWQLLMRALNGKNMSRDQVMELVDALRKLDVAPTQQGELFELSARQLLSGGMHKANSGLKPGSKIISGKHNAIHGIDGIGTAANGAPVIFEFSMYPLKKLNTDADGLAQLSPKWVVSRWNELISGASRERLEELAQLGIDPKWLRQVSEQDVAEWVRKFVAADESALSAANRMAAGLGPDDLILLGGR